MKITTILLKPVATFVYFFLFFFCKQIPGENVGWISEASTEMKIMNQTKKRQKKQSTYI
jgi:hypothetical protein